MVHLWLGGADDGSKSSSAEDERFKKIIFYTIIGRCWPCMSVHFRVSKIQNIQLSCADFSGTA